MKHVLYLFVLVFALLLTGCQRDSVVSPDGRLRVQFRLNEEGKPSYTVVRNQSEVLSSSSLGFMLRDADLSCGFRLLDTQYSRHDETWETVWGEERLIRDHHNEMTICLAHESGVKMDVVFRVFDDGFAFRYVFPEQERDSIVIMSELSSYHWTQEPQVWSIPWRTEYYEALWGRAPMSQCDTACSPVTLELADGGFAFMHEAALTDYPAQNYTFSGTEAGTYLTPWQSGVAAYEATPFSTPWRFVILTDKLSEMVASRIMLNLNEPCAIADPSWIRPMKFIGIWWGMHQGSMTWYAGPHHGATTANMKRYMDFASKNGIQAVLAEGWNIGWDDWSHWDDTKHFEFTTPYPDWDMDELARYSDSVGVEIVGHHETGGNAAHYEGLLDEAFSYYQAHGVHAVKTGYVYPIITTVDGKQYNRSQSGVRHYRKVIETAARYHICIDNHEPVMPTGLQRTWPNLMSQEGVRGQEWNAWANDGGSPCEHVTVLPFTRFMAGPVDYTPGVFNFENPIIPGTRVHSTLGNQLALFVVFYSPLQMACDLPENYQKHPAEFQFIRDVPCDWNQSRLLDGKIGEYVVMARQDRHSEDWFVGAVTNEEAREITIPLTFLNEGEWRATIYADAADADWRNNPYATAIKTQELNAADTLKIHLAAGGGCAIRFEKPVP